MRLTTLESLSTLQNTKHFIGVIPYGSVYTKRSDLENMRNRLKLCYKHEFKVLFFACFFDIKWKVFLLFLLNLEGINFYFILTLYFINQFYPHCKNLHIQNQTTSFLG